MSRIDELIRSFCPAGVEFVTVSEVAKYVRGVTYSKSDEQRDGPIRILRSNNITLSSNTLNFDNVKSVSENVRVRNDQYLYANDILVSAASGSKAHIGKVAFVRENLDYCFGGFMAVIRVENGVLPRFLFHLLIGRGFADYLEGALSTSTINNLNASIMGGFRIPVPPLEVQHEIVRILDNFSALKAELEARRRQYAFYRDQLLTSEDGVVRLVALSELAGDGFFSDGDWVESKDQDPLGDVRLTQLADVGVDVFRDRSDRWMREDQASRLRCTFLEPGDLLIARMPGPLGRACQVPESIGKAVTVVDVAILRSKHPEVLPRYVMYAINSNFVNRQILSFQTGGTRQRISRTNLGTVRIPLPAIDEQKRIVGILDSFDALVNDLSIGLPAELAARRKQYEYFRDRLLTFQEAPA